MVPPSANSKTPGAGAHGTCKGAALVAEQLALDEVAGGGRAVEDLEGAAGPRGAGVDRAAGQFLSGAGLAGDEHGEIGGSNPLQDAEDFAHGDARTHQAFEVVRHRRLDVHHFVLGREDQLGAAHPEAVLGRQVDLADLHGAHEGAIGRPQVTQHHAAGSTHDLCMTARDGGIGQHHVAGRKGADLDDISVHLPTLALFGTGLAGQRCARQVDPARPRLRDRAGDVGHCGSDGRKGGPRGQGPRRRRRVAERRRCGRDVILGRATKVLRARRPS